MTYTEHDSHEWTDTMWSVWHVITAKAGGVAWTEAELSRAVGARKGSDDDGDSFLTIEDVGGAVSDLYLAGYIVPAFPNEGWRRA